MESFHYFYLGFSVQLSCLGLFCIFSFIVYFKVALSCLAIFASFELY